MKAIYLDYAAATPLRPEVAAVMAPFAAGSFHNPSAVYLAARAVNRALIQARADCAAVLGVKPGEITFTAGSTESINLAIGGIMRQYPRGRIAVAATDHAAAAAAAEGFAPGRVDLIPVNSRGVIEPAGLKRAIKPSTAMVSMAYANSETGVIQPLSKLIRAAKNLNRKIVFHTDASAAGYLPLKVNRLGVDMLSIGGGKIYGPKQSGLLYARSGLKLEPLIYGGGQESGRRSGTQNPASIAGLAAALKLIQSEAKQESQRLQNLRDQLELALSKIAGAEPVISGKGRLPNLSSWLMPVSDGERLVMELDERGVQAATGAACSANTDQPSHVLLAMGLKPAEANRSLRLSIGRGTTQDQIKRAAKIIATVVQK